MSLAVTTKNRTAVSRRWLEMAEVASSGRTMPQAIWRNAAATTRLPRRLTQRFCYALVRKR